MKILFLDFETSDTKNARGRRDPSPFIPSNFLVSFGWRTSGFDTDTRGYRFLRHSEFTGNSAEACACLQSLLDDAELLVAHNLKFDLMWLIEAGFTYTGALYDTMVCEYILARGTGLPISLDASCARYGLAGKLGDLVAEYWSDGLGFGSMPIAVVQQYGEQDILCLWELYWTQIDLLKDEANASLAAVLDLSNEFIWCLVDMERAGIAISRDSLCAVRQTFEAERKVLRERLGAIVHEVMGDTPVNLDSPEQLSWVIYSRKVKDKDVWRKSFNIGTDDRGKRRRPPRMSAGDFVRTVKSSTDLLMRTDAKHCGVCDGSGVLHKLTKAGELFKRLPKCGECGGRGYVLESTGKVAGLRFTPSGPMDTASGGFATDGDTLKRLLSVRTGSKLDGWTVRYEFLEKYGRYNAVETYLTTFVAGIERGIADGFILHPTFNQCVTDTGRLSSTNPNFQNMPRANTFPVRRCIVSRWDGGCILEADKKQLEFRAYVYLAQDKQGFQDIADNVDVHAFTAKIIYDKEPSSDPVKQKEFKLARQDAKPHTFKPLYFGHSGTPAEVRYYEAFRKKYPDITQYQLDNIQRVLETGRITIPSGRQYDFPGTRRTPNGYVVNSTRISNYPCQGFATADVVPATVIDVRRGLIRRGLKSLLINTVHDSFVIDVYPGELEAVMDVIRKVYADIYDMLERRFGIKVNIPLEYEAKVGKNWMDMEDIA